MPEVGITIAGQRFAGWKTASVHRSIEHISGAFELTAAETEPADPLARALRPGQRCTVDLDNETVITGWIDDVETSFDAETHEIAVRGRDATGDLVDCAAMAGTAEWNGRKLEQIAADICRPFGIAVRAEVDTGKAFAKTGADGEETAFEAIETMCRHRGVLPVSDGRGALVFTRAGNRRAAGALVLGVNLIAGNFTRSDRERFSVYVVKGNGAPSESWIKSTEPEGRATDPAVGRYRPRNILAGEEGDGASFVDRAKWEAAVRAGRSQSGRYTVQGWRDEAGALWAPNTLVEVTDSYSGVNRDLLIAGVEYTRGDQGTRSVLSVVRPEAFKLLAVAESVSANGDWGG